MDSAPADVPSPAEFIGREVLRLRTAKGWTQGRLAKEAHMAVSRIGQIENATIPATLDNAKDLDAALGTDGILERLMILVGAEPALPDWLEEFAKHERRALAVSEYTSQIVPGLLQTEDYARALLRSAVPPPTEAEVDRLVAARMERQRILDRSDPPALWFVLDQQVLERPVGGPDVMAAQLDHLAVMAGHPAVNIQVLPKAIGAHPALGGSLTILALPDRANVAYLEGSSIGQLFEDAHDAARYGLAYDHLQAHALTPGESVSMIRLTQEDMIKMAQTHPQQDLNGAHYETSSYSNTQGGQCVAVARNLPGIVAVKDSKDMSREALTASPAAWGAFLAHL